MHSTNNTPSRIQYFHDPCGHPGTRGTSCACVRETRDDAHRLELRCLHCGDQVMPPAVCECTLAPAQRWERRVATGAALGILLMGAGLLAGVVYGVVRLLRGLLA